MLKLYKCAHCGNIVEMVEDKGVTPVCCGEAMTLLDPNTTDAATEKHVPVVEKDGSKITVKVGGVEHPMTDEHHISFIILETDKGVQKKYLDPAGKTGSRVRTVRRRNLQSPHMNTAISTDSGKPLSISHKSETQKGQQLSCSCCPFSIPQRYFRR